MTRHWAIFEPCAGSAALTYHLCGMGGRGLMPYQGSKWKYRRELEAIVRELGFEGAPELAFLNDAGPWAVAHLLLQAEKRDEVLAELEAMAEQDPKVAYDSILEEGTDGLASVLYAARFLFLQRLSFSGKAVGDVNGRWAAPGFNKTSAYGAPAGSTKWKGEVKPQVPGLIRNLQKLPRLRVKLLPEPHHAPVLVYLDPTYKDSTKYPNGHITREEVVYAALGLAVAHEAVMVSEAEPIPELVERGWKAVQIGKREGSSPFKTTKPEWVTYTSKEQT